MSKRLISLPFDHIAYTGGGLRAKKYLGMGEKSDDLKILKMFSHFFSEVLPNMIQTCQSHKSVPPWSPGKTARLRPRGKAHLGGGRAQSDSGAARSDRQMSRTDRSGKSRTGKIRDRLFVGGICFDHFWPFFTQKGHLFHQSQMVPKIGAVAGSCRLSGDLGVGW